MAPVILPESARNAANEITKYFTFYSDFPKPGINFWDVFALFRNRDAFNLLNTIFAGYAEVMKNKVDVIVGVEARGFLLGPILANLLECSFVPVRKKGKLPGKTNEISYTIEYGADTLVIQDASIKPGQRVIVVDDCLATGGTLCATCKLIHNLGGRIVDCLIIYRIPDVPPKDDLPSSVTTLCQ